MALYPLLEDNEDTARRRRRAVRMAGWIAVVAAIVYIGFILTGVLRS